MYATNSGKQQCIDGPPRSQTPSALAASESIFTLSLGLALTSYFSPFLNPIDSA